MKSVIKTPNQPDVFREVESYDFDEGSCVALVKSGTAEVY